MVVNGRCTPSRQVPRTKPRAGNPVRFHDVGASTEAKRGRVDNLAIKRNKSARSLRRDSKPTPGPRFRLETRPTILHD
jgi:hypothetical protein